MVERDVLAGHFVLRVAGHSAVSVIDGENTVLGIGQDDGARRVLKQLLVEPVGTKAIQRRLELTTFSNPKPCRRPGQDQTQQRKHHQQGLLLGAAGQQGRTLNPVIAGDGQRQPVQNAWPDHAASARGRQTELPPKRPHGRLQRCSSPFQAISAGHQVRISSRVSPYGLLKLVDRGETANRTRQQDSAEPAQHENGRRGHQATGSQDAHNQDHDVTGHWRRP